MTLVKKLTILKILGISIIFLGVVHQVSIAQVSPCNCTANVGSGTVNFSSLTWTHNSGPACPTAGSTSYTGNLCVNLANGSNLTMDKDFTITGGFGISNGGNSTFTLPSGRLLKITGSMGDDANNNVTFTINGALEVGGTIWGKNSNQFGGNGSVKADGLNFNQPPTCPSCGIDWDVNNCVPSSPFCTMVLPITLLFFNVEEHADLVQLKWTTATELNFDKFIIERTLDGKEFFEIGNVKGSGNSVTRKNYSFDDRAPIVGRSYYRLKALDYDGQFEYFGLEICNYVGPKAFAIYPNPSSAEQIKLRLNFNPDEDAQVEVFSNLGVKLAQYSISQLGSDIVLPSGLRAGSYLVRVTSGSFSQVIRFSVI